MTIDDLCACVPSSPVFICALRRVARLSALTAIAWAPWLVAAHVSQSLDVAKPLAAPDPDFPRIFYPKPAAVEEAERQRWLGNPPQFPRLMTPVTLADELAWASERHQARLAKVEAMENARIAGSVADWVSDGQSMRPLFSAAGLSPFAAPLSNGADMGRLTQLRNAMADHVKSKPEGWGALVARAKDEWARGGDMALFRAVDAMINDVPYVDGTDGTFFSPRRLLARGGVCKDFAAAKYILLRDAGFPAARLRVAVLTPRDQGGEWHVVTLALAEGSKDPVVLDLLPFPIAASALAKAGKSVATKVGELSRLGIDPDRVDYASSAYSLISLSRYGTKRSIDWVGNETGGAAFARRLPDFPAEPPIATTGFASGVLDPKSARAWIATPGMPPYSVVSLAPRPSIQVASARGH
jgi:predicted transglutaminase-like cysteine proteinase